MYKIYLFILLHTKFYFKVCVKIKVRDNMRWSHGGSIFSQSDQITEHYINWKFIELFHNSLSLASN